ncbi:MAG: GNAT family N-acetyltransferase [Bacteroidales bacterium]
MKILLQSDERHYDKMALIMSSTDPWITLQRDQAACLASLKGEGKEVYAIEEEGEVIGVIVLQMTGTFRGYLQVLCIDDKYRGKGYGKAAVAFCEKRIFSTSPNFFLCVSSFNTVAQQFYYDLGFSLIGEIKDFVLEGYSELFLRKTIGSFSSFKPV